MSDTLEDMIYRRTLSCGTIQVTRDQGDVSLNDLFDIAERRNPKRAFLFVSKVLGRHIPVPPSWDCGRPTDSLPASSPQR